jgi:DNA-binding Lrp family transcriptional regulator
VMEKNHFPDEPLDAKDRGIIQAVYGHGPDGVGFNALVEEVRPFASRGTVALRVERLVRLGYLERTPRERPGKVTPIRLSTKCFTLMFTLEKTRGQVAKLLSSLEGISSEITAAKGKNASQHEAELRRWYEEFRTKLNSFFSMTGSIAVFYSTSAAGDLFLPFIVDDYKFIFQKLLTVLQGNREFRGLARKLMSERAESEGTDLEEIRDEVRRQLRNYSTSRRPHER